jgi:hypothetical protein
MPTTVDLVFIRLAAPATRFGDVICHRLDGGTWMSS